MEIERKFLIKEKDKIYPSDFSIEDLKKEIKRYGRQVVQHYFPKELIPGILDMLDIKLRFEPSQLRIRRLKDKYFITAKSPGGKARNEFEKRISKELFKELSELKEKTIEKIRLMKKYRERFIFIDYYPKQNLITAEIEFKSIREADAFKTHMKDISEKSKYKNSRLAH